MVFYDEAQQKNKETRAIEMEQQKTLLNANRMKQKRKKIARYNQRGNDKQTKGKNTSKIFIIINRNWREKNTEVDVSLFV